MTFTSHTSMGPLEYSSFSNSQTSGISETDISNAMNTQLCNLTALAWWPFTKDWQNKHLSLGKSPMCSLYVLANYLLLCLNMSELVKLQGSVSLQMLHHHLKMKTAMKGHRNSKKKKICWNTITSNCFIQ